MVKSGLILGIVALIFTAGATMISPICTPCLAIFIGLIAGYLAGMQEKPPSDGQSAKIGAAAGAISGIGAILGQFIGAAINTKMVGPEGIIKMLHQLNLPTTGNIANYYLPVTYGSACCLGLFNILIMAGLGALGGLLWLQINGKKYRTTI